MEFVAHASSSAGNLYQVRSTHGPPLLIECGLAVGKIQYLLDHTLTSHVGCLLSHHHGDHAKGAEKVMAAGVDVYASEQTWAALQLRGHRAIRIAPRVELEMEGWRVLPFDLRHDADGAMGYLVEERATGERLLFACDTAYVPYTFPGLTHIAVECNYSMEILRASSVPAERKARVIRHHMSLERVAALLEANDLSKVKGIWLLHLSDGHSDAAVFRQTLMRATGRPVYVAPKETDHG